VSVAVAGGAGFGDALRDWRRHRGLSQLDLSLEAEVSPRHLSFLETGRSSPSQEMVLRLLGALRVPLWDRNRLLLAAGYAPAYGESSLDDDSLSQVKYAIRLLLRRHEPYPAYAMDGAWNVIEANGAFLASLGAPAGDGAEPVNVLRLLCAPHPFRPLVANWEEVTRAVLLRVRRQLDAPNPPAALGAVVDEIRSYPGVEPLFRAIGAPARRGPFIPIEVRSGDDTLRWLTTLVTIGGALDVTLDELVVECFFPADGETDRLAQRAAS
jgi:transcriptional regulator with XRE-family HTH domain